MFKYIINSAIALAKKGLPIFPCNPETKQPLTTHGFKDATIDVHSIKAYWSNYPKAMIGLPTRSISKIWAVDCDGQKGKDNFLELCSYYGYEPDTLIQNTPLGGWHYLFVFPEGIVIRNSTSKIAKHVDVRGKGGYIIIAPSCRSDGRCYIWENKKRTSEAPDWLITLVTQDKVSTAYKKGYPIQNNSELHPYVKKAIEKEYNNVRNAPKGKRNETLNNAAFTLYQFVAGSSVNEHQIHTILIKAAYESGLTQDDGNHSVIKTINSGKRTGMEFSRCIPCSSDNSFPANYLLYTDEASPTLPQ